MPNWCSNYIKISGDESNMKPLYDFFREGEEIVETYYKQFREFRENFPDEDAFNSIGMKEVFVMSTLVPEDEEFEKIKESGQYLLSPYTEFWGCKWDIHIHDGLITECTPTKIQLSPITAWSPPEPFCKRLSEKYGVDVEISFSEGGANFAGRSRYSNGKEIESVLYSYREGMYYLETESFWENTYSDLEWMFCENPNITFDEVLGQMYPFVKDENDIKELNELYHNFKVDETTGE